MDPQNDGAIDEIGNMGLGGVKRFVRGAHLVYKRAVGDGSFEELWIYPLEQDKSNNANNIKRSILAGTDIADGESHSEDGTQSCDIWTAGNAQIIHIKGLPQ